MSHRDTRAVGVEYIISKPQSDQTLVTVNPLRLVNHDGTFGSPAVLERSAVGAKNILMRPV